MMIMMEMMEMMIMMELVDLKVKLRLPRFPEQGLAEVLRRFYNYTFYQIAILFA